MTIQETIQKAIEGGYKIGGHPLRWNEKTKSWWYYWMSEDENGDEIELENPACLDHPDGLYPALLDPSFWKALGKSMGWGTQHTGRIALHKCTVRCQPMWKLMWHHLIDYLARGKSVDEFFKNLT